MKIIKIKINYLLKNEEYHRIDELIFYETNECINDININIKHNFNIFVGNIDNAKYHMLCKLIKLQKIKL